MTKVRKNKSPIWPVKGTYEELWRAAKIFLKKNSSCTARQQQSFGGYQQGSGSNRQVKSKQKGNIVQNVISTGNSNKQIRKCSSIDKKTIFCKRGSKIVICRKIKTLSRDMKNNEKGFENFRTCGGIQNSFQQESSPTKNSRNTSHESISKTPGTSGNRKHVGEGNHMPNQSFKRGRFEQCVRSKKKGRGKPSCNHLKAPESVHTIAALQNGRLVLPEKNVAEG